MSVACDAQGADAARPFHEKAGAEFTTVVDQANVFGSLYGLRAVPFAIYIDEEGRIVKPPHGISSANADALADLGAWIAGQGVPAVPGKMERDPAHESVREADLRFALGSHLLARGERTGAVAEWRKALELDPQNWIIHKQIWAVEHPEAFYSGPVDYDWQKSELERERQGR